MTLTSLDRPDSSGTLTAADAPRSGPSSPFPFGPRPPGREPPLPDRSPSGSIGLVLFDLLAQLDDDDGADAA